jgi:hypothetical protein
MFRRLRLPLRAVAYVVSGLLLGEPIRWIIGKTLDWAYNKWGDEMISVAADGVERAQPYVVAVLGTLIVVVLIANRREITMKFTKSVMRGGKAGLMLGGVRGAEIDGATLIGGETGAEIVGGSDTRFNDTIAVGDGRQGGAGFKVKDSARPKFGNSESHGFETGYDVEGSPDPDFGSAKAYRESPRKYFSGWTPPKQGK